MMIDDNAYQNRTKLIGDERFKRLYHYTSFDSFVKIWLNQNLKFSPLSNVNDIQEVDFKSGVINSHRLDLCRKINDIRLSYKQISFTMDYDSVLKGCMSPMMWGLYADKRKGVCIELDYSKIHFPQNTLQGIVKYQEFLKWQNIVDTRIKTEKGFQAYVRKHQNQMFFTKQTSWAGENEYRVLNNEVDFLNIDGAISAVYLTSCYSNECLFVEKLVNDKVPVMFLTYIGTFNNWAIPVLRSTKEQREYDEAIKQRMLSQSDTDI